MHFSFSTVYTTVFASNILFILAACLLRNKSFLFKVGYGCLGILLGLAAVRLLLPFEFFFTQTILLPIWPSEIIALFYHTLFFFAGYDITPLALLGGVWIGGSLHQTFRFIRETYRMRKFILSHGREVTDNAIYADILSKIWVNAKHPHHVRVIKVRNIPSPMLYGLFSPYILLPEQIDFSEQELYYILSHEISHYLHGDLLLKYALRFITILYWWNPACHILNHQAELLVEMHVDEKLTDSGPDAASEYLECLLHIAECGTKAATSPASLYIGFGTKTSSDLTKRFEMLLKKKSKPNRFIQSGLVVFTLLFCVLSYMFIFEGNPPLPEYLDCYFIPSEENTYFIQTGDGTYEIYIKGSYSETVDSLRGYSKDIPIYKSKEEIPDENKK